MNSETATPTDQPSVEELREKLNELRDGLSDLGKIIRGIAHEKADDVRQSASGYVDQGKAKTEELTHSCEDYIRQKPLKSVLIAGAVGAVVGALWLRR
jgi:ElaB/YqjD/DUF883 family membrane-anchored ribosome-binding protein